VSRKLDIFSTILAIIGIVGFTLYSFWGLERMYDSFVYLSYYIFIFLTCSWAIIYVHFLYEINFNLKEFVLKHKIGILISLAFTILFFVSIPPIIRIVHDEPNVISLSQRFYYEKKAMITESAYWINNYFFPAESSVAARPLLFSMLINYVHVFLGYKVSNAFIVNFIITFLFLFIIYKVIHKNHGHPYAIGGQFIICSMPIFGICATSAGFDLLFILLTFLIIYNCYILLKSPSALTLVSFASLFKY